MKFTINRTWLTATISALVVGLTVFLLCYYVWECRPDVLTPKVTIIPLTPDPTNDNKPVLSGTAIGGTSAIDRVEYRIDAGAWMEASFTPNVGDPKTITYTFTTYTLDDGEHQVEVRARDTAGNETREGNYATDSFVVDTMAPEVNITALAPDPTEQRTPSLGGTATDISSPIDGVGCRVDGGAWMEASFTPNVGDPKTITYTFTTYTLDDGEHQVEVRARDTAGNETREANYATDSFVVERPQTAFEKIVGTDLGDYSSYQVKITYIGIQLKVIPTLAFSSTNQPLDMSRFKNYNREGIDYSNDDIHLFSFTASPEEIKNFVDSIALIPALTTTDVTAESELSLMIMRDVGTDKEQCFEVLVGGSDCGVLILKLYTSLDPTNVSAINIVTLIGKFLQVYP